MDDRWSLGVLLGLPWAGLTVIIAIVWIIGWAKSDSYEKPVFIGGGIAVLAIVVIGTGVAMWPWKTEYHKWQHIGGEVSQVSSRLLGGQGGPTQRFVVVFESGEERSCDDTRCSLLKVGDHLDLSCKRKWQWSGTHGWDCNYVSAERGAT